MITREVVQCVGDLPSYKVKHYVSTYIQLLEQTFGQMFDIGIAYYESDEDLRYVAISFNLIVKDTVTVVYGHPQPGHYVPLNEDSKSIVYVRPDARHMNYLNQDRGIDTLLIDRFGTIIGRMDKETIIDGYGITCSAFIDPISFRSQLLQVA